MVRVLRDRTRRPFYDSSTALLSCIHSSVHPKKYIQLQKFPTSRYPYPFHQRQNSQVYLFQRRRLGERHTDAAMLVGDETLDISPYARSSSPVNIHRITVDTLTLAHPNIRHHTHQFPLPTLTPRTIMHDLMCKNIAIDTEKPPARLALISAGLGDAVVFVWI